MELRLANAISNMLPLGFKFFFRDIEYFFSSVHFVLQFLPTKWNSLGAKMQFSNSCGAKVPINENSVGGGKGLQIGELDLVMNRLEVLGLLDDSEKMSFLSEEGLIGLFDEEEPSFEEIKETFGVFDVNKDGFIDAIELQRVLCKLGLKESCSLEECKKMIKSCDCNGDGVIDLNEFVKFMEKCLC